MYSIKLKNGNITKIMMNTVSILFIYKHGVVSRVDSKVQLIKKFIYRWENMFSALSCGFYKNAL